jgi:hypothetical protein
MVCLYILGHPTVSFLGTFSGLTYSRSMGQSGSFFWSKKPSLQIKTSDGSVSGFYSIMEYSGKGVQCTRRSKQYKIYRD